MATRGRPVIHLRVHPDVMKMLEERALKSTRGARGGGVSAYVRRVLYEHLGFDSGERAAVEEDGPE